MLLVKNQRLTRLDGLAVAGTINAAPNQPAAKLINKSDNIPNQARSTIINNLSEDTLIVNKIPAPPSPPGYVRRGFASAVLGDR